MTQRVRHNVIEIGRLVSWTDDQQPLLLLSRQQRALVHGEQQALAAACTMLPSNPSDGLTCHVDGPSYRALPPVRFFRRWAPASIVRLSATYCRGTLNTLASSYSSWLRRRSREILHRWAGRMCGGWHTFERGGSVRSDKGSRTAPRSRFSSKFESGFAAAGVLGGDERLIVLGVAHPGQRLFRWSLPSRTVSGFSSAAASRANCWLFSGSFVSAQRLGQVPLRHRQANRVIRGLGIEHAPIAGQPGPGAPRYRARR